MNFKIKETNKIKELSITDPKTGCSWTADMIGNHGGLDNLEYSEDNDQYTITQEDFDWWESVISEYQEADDRRYEIAKTLNSPKYEDFMQEMEQINCDLEYYPARMNSVCDEFDTEE